MRSAGRTCSSRTGAVRAGALRRCCRPPRDRHVDGDAWLGVVPFRMSGVRPARRARRCRAARVPGAERAHLRAPSASKPGVWFFSLDAASPAGGDAPRARGFTCRTSAPRCASAPDGDGGALLERPHASRGAADAAFDARYGPTGPVAHAERRARSSTGSPSATASTRRRARAAVARRHPPRAVAAAARLRADQPEHHGARRGHRAAAGRRCCISPADSTCASGRPAALRSAHDPATVDDTRWRRGSRSARTAAGRLHVARRAPLGRLRAPASADRRAAARSRGTPASCSSATSTLARAWTTTTSIETFARVIAHARRRSSPSPATSSRIVSPPTSISCDA